MIRLTFASWSAASAVLIAATLIPTSRAAAQGLSGSATSPAFEVKTAAPPRVAPISLRQSAIDHTLAAAVVLPPVTVAPAFQAAPTGRQRSTARKVFGALFGATAGLFGGGYLGARLEGDCNCDDQGLQGALIGAPIGAVVGGILGAVLF